MKKKILIPVFIALVGIVFGSGYFIGQNARPAVEKITSLENKELDKPQAVDFSSFWNAWHLVEQEYVDRDELDYEKMVYGSISGLVNSLGDPYSVFMEPKESKKFMDDMSGSFEGIGAEVGIRQGVLTIISPLEGNPAQEAGIKSGDKIIKVDDTLTTDLSLDEAVSLIRGPRGTEVRLLIMRENWEEAREIKVVRDTIKIPIIEWSYRENNIAYVQLYHFTENSSAEFARIANQIASKDAQGIVLDLRDNPGGYLNAAVNIASWYLPKGDPVVLEDFGNDDKKAYKSQGYMKLADVPTVILINQGSASASEIVAGALRDLDNVWIVGERSFGKGSVQQLEEMLDGSSIKLTVAKWLTPSGVSISEEGIEPDIEAKITEEDIDNMRDPQLDKAIEVLE